MSIVTDLLECAEYLRSWQPFHKFVYTDSGEDHYYIKACTDAASRIMQLESALRECLSVMDWDEGESAKVVSKVKSLLE